MPVYRKHLGRARVWNIFQNNFEEYATTNETDFMGSVTMSPASGRQICKDHKSLWMECLFPVQISDSVIEQDDSMSDALPYTHISFNLM